MGLSVFAVDMKAVTSNMATPAGTLARVWPQGAQMTSSPSSSRSIQSPSCAPFLVGLIAMLFLSACEDKHIGRPCDIGVDTTMLDPKVVTVNPQALECPSRVCIWPAQDKTTDTQGLCTDECSSDDDCSDGEKRGGASEDRRCKTGFACRTILPRLENTSLSCKPVCVCKDFLVTDDPNVKPPSCP
jgi:hypothetical protein